MEIVSVPDCFSGITTVPYVRSVPGCGTGLWNQLHLFIIRQNALEPLHAQFDYLKNTVSVVNDYYKPFEGYTVVAQVYDINSKKVFEESAKVNLPSDGVVNDALTIRFPEDISQVHFIKLRLKDEKGKEVSSNFYWRSNDKYEGKETLTGPTSSGFEDLAKLKQAKLNTSYKVRKAEGKYFVDITLKNTSNSIAFFNQLQFLDQELCPVRRHSIQTISFHSCRAKVNL